jgi:hypothetical protein
VINILIEVKSEDKMKRNARQSFQIQIMADQKQQQNVKYDKYLNSMITKDARCTREIKSIISMATTALNKKKNLFTSKSD